jgi:hypothetical protein
MLSSWNREIAGDGISRFWEPHIELSTGEAQRTGIPYSVWAKDRDGEVEADQSLGSGDLVKVAGTLPRSGRRTLQLPFTSPCCSCCFIPGLHFGCVGKCQREDRSTTRFEPEIVMRRPLRSIVAEHLESAIVSRTVSSGMNGYTYTVNVRYSITHLQTKNINNSKPTTLQRYIVTIAIILVDFSCL